MLRLGNQRAFSVIFKFPVLSWPRELGLSGEIEAMKVEVGDIMVFPPLDAIHITRYTQIPSTVCKFGLMSRTHSQS